MKNHPIELQDHNVNIHDSNSINSENKQEISLFEHIALKVHNYEGNFNYVKRMPGILKLLQLIFGLLALIFIFTVCSNYYDPWETKIISGFAGGKVEVLFFVSCSYALFTTFLFTILYISSNSYEKNLSNGNFDFLVNIILFSISIFSSLLFLIELCNRNTGILEFEHFFWTKVFTSILGLINSFLYLLSSFNSLKIPSSHKTKI